ncbi:MAG: glycosyltransferase family 2 protein, partial [Solirubrobacteraceae bacterium]
MTQTANATGVRISVVLPCLNEASVVGEVVRRALAALAETSAGGEVIVVDNGSTDDSALNAAAAGARIVEEPARGYGNALRAGFAAATGEYVVMADADLSYDLFDIPRFVAELDAGADMVIGDRMDGILPGAMPSLHRLIGNPVLSGALNAMFRSGVRDAHCGLRAFRRSHLMALDLRSQGMELASEMVLASTRAGLEVRQLPIVYHPRAGTSKLSSFRDGWRHVRLMLVHSPTHLFLIPGALIAMAGMLATLVVLSGVDVFGRQWDVHALVAGSLALIIGLQVLAFGLIAQTFAAYYMGAREQWFLRARARLRLKHGLVAGALVAFPGAIIAAAIL